MKTQTQITFSQAVSGYTLYAQARGLSPHTIADYHNTFRKFQIHLGADLPILKITPQHVRLFLIAQPVTNKTLLNYHTGLSALWTWLISEKWAADHILRHVDAPEPEQRAIVPYTEQDIRAMLACLGSTRTYRRRGQRPSNHGLPHVERNRAIILTLLDTGVRASELCDLAMHNLDLRNHRIKVFGKGAKERSLPISSNTGQAIWRYLAAERSEAHIGEPLFITSENKPFDRHLLRQQLERIGARAGVTDITVHRFRHTFAITYLRNHGDPYALQMMLGHSTMEMVRTYLAIAQADLDDSHRRASPVSNWRL